MIWAVLWSAAIALFYYRWLLNNEIACLRRKLATQEADALQAKAALAKFEAFIAKAELEVADARERKEAR